MSRGVVMAGINDVVGYLYTQEEADAIIAGHPAHEREARAKGIPQLGSGRIYPISEEAITVDPFEIPDYFKKICALDFGWDHPTAAVKMAMDADTDTIYLTHCYRGKEKTPHQHCGTLKGWGAFPWAWPMDGWDKSGKHGTKPGQAYKDAYADHGLNMLSEHAKDASGSNGVEAGLMRILERMESGRFKVFSSCSEWFEEFRLYHRKDGVIFKEYDDLMDATRYAEMCIRFATTGKKSYLQHNVRRDWVA